MWVFLLLIFYCSAQCVIDDTTVFTFSPNFTLTPLLNNDAAITAVREASAAYFEFRSTYQTDILNSNDVFVTLLQIIEPFPYPLYQETAVRDFLDGVTIEDLNKRLWALQMVVEGVRRSACTTGEKLNIIDEEGKIECEGVIADTLNNNVLNNSLFYIIIVLLFALLASIIVTERMRIYRIEHVKRD